jgi:molecular chaperone GrpE
MTEEAGDNETTPETESENRELGARNGSSGSDDLEELRRQNEEYRDKYLRLAAEIDNLRKRSAREVENARKYGIERFAEALLPVFDSLEAGLAVENVDVDALREGQEATLRLLEQAFKSVGVEQIDPAGEPFDPNLHEAMSMLPAAHAEPDSVIDVVQKGYLIQERLLRPARVVVAADPTEEAKE